MRCMFRDELLRVSLNSRINCCLAPGDLIEWWPVGHRKGAGLKRPPVRGRPRGLSHVTKLILIALAGAAGTLARYFLGGVVQRAYGGTFPWGTVAVNMAGCFLFGLVWSLAEERLVISGETRAVVLIGFMGAFTTFSTFIFESGTLLRDSQYALMFGNLALQNTTGLVFLFAGLAAGRTL